MLSAYAYRILSYRTVWRIDGAASRGGYGLILQLASALPCLPTSRFFGEQAHARELLLDRFWPNMEPEAARHNLRQTLFSLRRLLEPAGIPAGSLLIADRTRIRLSAASVRTDVGEFRELLQRAAVLRPSSNAYWIWSRRLPFTGVACFPICTKIGC